MHDQNTLMMETSQCSQLCLLCDLKFVNVKEIDSGVENQQFDFVNHMLATLKLTLSISENSQELEVKITMQKT